MLLLLLAAQVAQAEPYRPPTSTIVAEPVAVLLAGWDRDGDGRTTLAEARAGVEAATAGPEWANGVGYLAFADWAERYLGDRNVTPSAFEIDRNGDNRITREELLDRIEAIVARMDANKDGAVSRAEMLTIRGNPRGGERPEGRRDNIDRPRRR
jgi:hypothetical protein